MSILSQFYVKFCSNFYGLRADAWQFQRRRLHTPAADQRRESVREAYSVSVYHRQNYI